MEVVILSYCLFSQWPPSAKSTQFWGVCGVSGGCLRVSGWCLSSSGKCMGGIFVRQVENSWIRVVIFSWCSFSQWPRMSQKGAKARIRLFTGRGGFFGPGWLILLPNGLFWSTTNFWRGDGVKFWFRPFINTRYYWHLKGLGQRT